MRLEDEMMLTPQDEALRRALAEKSFMAAAAEVRSTTMHLLHFHTEKCTHANLELVRGTSFVTAL